MTPRPAIREVLVGAAIAALAGLLVGTLGAFKHQAGVSVVTGAGFPYGLLLSLAMIAAVLLALRVTFGTRLYAGAAAVGVLIAVGVFSLRGPGGSQVVVGDVAGVIWMIAPLGIAVAVVLPPGRRAAASRRADGILESDTKEEDRAP